MESKKNILIITPTATHPQNAGNRARIYNMLDQLQKLGFAVHVLYDGSERAAGHVKHRHDLRAMEKKWDGFYYAPNKLSAYLLKRQLKSRLLFSRRFFSLFYYLCLIFPNRRTVVEALDSACGRTGKALKVFSPSLFHVIKKVFPDGVFRRAGGYGEGREEIDLWYKNEVDYIIRVLKEQISFDIVLVEYVFMSKTLEHFGDGVRKIIDTHDVFSNRKEKYTACDIEDLSFSLTPKQEAVGLSRADVILAIQGQEKIYFETLTDKPVIVVGHFIPIVKLQKKHSNNKRILFIGAANSGNIHTAQYFIDRIFPRIQADIPDAKFVVAGKVADCVVCSAGCELMGEVESLAEIYGSIDVVINPTLIGTGLKIKNLEALGFGKPLVSSSHAAVGMEEAKGAFAIADTPEAFAREVVKILSDPSLCRSMSLAAGRFVSSYNRAVQKNLLSVFGDGAVKSAKIQKTRSIFPEQKGGENKFIIFTWPRTGATTLTYLLRGHPDIYIADEPFHHKTGRKFAPTDIVGVSEYMTELWEKHTGIKHNWGLSFEQNMNLLLDPNNKIIFLWRKNALQREVSFAISRQTNKWDSSNKDRKDIMKRVLEPLDADEIKRNLDSYLFEVEQYKRLLKKQGENFYEITYEELYDPTGSYEHKRNIIQNMIEFLGKDTAAFEQNKELRKLFDPNISKVNSEKTYRTIPNIDGIEQRLGRDETGWLFK